MSNYPVGGNGAIMSDLMTSNIEGVNGVSTGVIKWQWENR